MKYDQSLIALLSVIIWLLIIVFLAKKILKKINVKKKTSRNSQNITQSTEEEKEIVFSFGDGSYWKEDEKEDVSKYSYTAKTHMMTGAEERCFRILEETFSQKFYIFPQMHLSKLLDHKVKGQNYYGAFLHINSKSVDFVLCRKTNLEPVCAVELDDYTHNYKSRKERDVEVERMFEQARFPLVRITNPQKMSKQEMIEIFRKKIVETWK